MIRKQSLNFNFCFCRSTLSADNQRWTHRTGINIDKLQDNQSIRHQAGKGGAARIKTSFSADNQRWTHRTAITKDKLQVNQSIRYQVGKGGAARINHRHRE
jgi:alpha-ketoglutarate-dependent taurine dioxygenase